MATGGGIAGNGHDAPITSLLELAEDGAGPISMKQGAARLLHFSLCFGGCFTFSLSPEYDSTELVEVREEGSN